MDCDTCDGHGWIYHPETKYAYAGFTECPDCLGTGQIEDETTDECEYE